MEVKTDDTSIPSERNNNKVDEDHITFRQAFNLSACRQIFAGVCLSFHFLLSASRGADLLLHSRVITRSRAPVTNLGRASLRLIAPGPVDVELVALFRSYYA